jgi:Rrf2 family protein
MRALVELSFATGRGPLSATSIAHKQALSTAYLEQLLHRLKKHGLVSSIRGPKGGYLLAKDPGQVTVGEIVRALDGLTAARNGKSVRSDDRAQHIANAVYRCVHERLAEALDAVTLQDVCDDVRESAEEPLDHRYVFHI